MTSLGRIWILLCTLFLFWLGYANLTGQRMLGTVARVGGEVLQIGTLGYLGDYDYSIGAEHYHVVGWHK